MWADLLWWKGWGFGIPKRAAAIWWLVLSRWVKWGWGSQSNIRSLRVERPWTMASVLMPTRTRSLEQGLYLSSCPLLAYILYKWYDMQSKLNWYSTYKCPWHPDPADLTAAVRSISIPVHIPHDLWYIRIKNIHKVIHLQTNDILHDLQSIYAMRSSNATGN